jgi:hypothetical protein
VLDDDVDRVMVEIERGLQADDPRFVRRIDRQPRREAVAALATGSLLLASTVLLTVGLATFSPLAWWAGGAAFIAAFVVSRFAR